MWTIWAQRSSMTDTPNIEHKNHIHSQYLRDVYPGLEVLSSPRWPLLLDTPCPIEFAGDANCQTRADLNENPHAPIL